ncbi:MAG: DUF763 domain-containing protein [Bacillota bacterium]
MRTGIANLPLHSGKCPRWLFEKMVELARVLVELMVMEDGPDGVLNRLSDPFWFQALGCVLGFDWHSSGLTTTVCGALKEALREGQRDLGIFVCGGKGATALKTPEEIIRIADRYPLGANPEELVRASRLTAKVDQAALQDGYDLYHHSFIFSVKGTWTVVQQGMNPEARRARRYHWLSNACGDFVVEPHTAVCCDTSGPTLNLVARESDGSRKNLPAISGERPELLVGELKSIQDRVLDLPERHRLLIADLNPARLKTVFEKSYLRQPEDFISLLETPGVGARGVRALSLIAELVYGTAPSYRDPARFAFAHGGKDGTPFPVDRVTYDHSIKFLKKAVDRARIGESDKKAALARLERIFQCKE